MKENTCVVCYSLVDSTAANTPKMPCDHILCDECYRSINIISDKKACPCCRMKFVDNDDDQIPSWISLYPNIFDQCYEQFLELYNVYFTISCSHDTHLYTALNDQRQKVCKLRKSIWASLNNSRSNGHFHTRDYREISESLRIEEEELRRIQAIINRAENATQRRSTREEKRQQLKLNDHVRIDKRSKSKQHDAFLKIAKNNSKRHFYFL